MQGIGDFHIHVTHSSDSLLQPRTLLKIASRKGIDVVAVTDHNTLDGSFETIREAKNQNSEVIVIPGMEISTDRGHVLGLFIHECVRSRSYLDVVDEIKSQNGLIIIPHPCKKSQKFNDSEFAIADLLEGLNGRATSKENNDALSLGKSLGKTMVAGSDAHFPFEVGRTRTILPIKPACLDDMKKMLKEGLVLGIENDVDVASPYVTHMLSCSLEMFRRLMWVHK